MVETSTDLNSKQANPVTRAPRPSVFAEFKTVPTLSSVEIERMYAIFSKYYINHNREQFTSDLFEKDQVILLRDSSKRTIQGFSTLLKVDLKPYGYQATGIYSGDTVLEKEYWGNKALGVAFLKYLWLEKVKTPTLPVYWFLISKGYKTYLLMANNFKTHFPRVEKSTPIQYKNIMDKFYGHRFAKNYKAEHGTIEFDHTACSLKEKVAEISDDLFKNKKIQFFAKMNPRWDRGDELACIAEMTLWMPLQYFIKKTFLKKKT
ncbi:MAG: hypothetical protein JNM24_15720 [Bdellovibrionaceae bacterium]|jgi:hypothetical protein|nr:hypothetical protein [Pseudobdellovibrionaceae bacterium]